MRLVLANVMILLILSGLAIANGLNLNSLGTKALSMGGAFIGLADDFSLVYWNPAGAGFLRQPAFGTYVTDLIPTNYYQLTVPPELEIEARTKLSHYLGFLAGYYRPLSENLVLGIGIYTPSGLGAYWKGDDFSELSAGVAYDWTSKIGMISLSTLIAWKIDSRISIGATLNLNYGMFSLKRWAGEIETEPGVFVDLGQYEESLHGWGWGLTLGVLAKPTDSLSFGLTVKTPSSIKLKGDATMYTLGYLGYPESSEAKRTIKWPWFVGGGLALKPAERITLTADLQWTGWSGLKNMKTTYLDPVWMTIMTETGNDELRLDWKNRLQVRFGFEYKISSSLTLRAGYYSDPSPAPDYTMNVLLANFDFQVLTAGFGYEWKGLSINWGLEYLSGKKREVTFEELIEAGTSGQAMPGTYRMHLIVPNLSIAFKF
jgi:long-chain fatty acid transport protein